MKKILIVISVFFLLIGCSLNKQTLDFENLEKQIDEITSENLDLNEVVMNVEKDTYYDNMEYLKDDSLIEMGIDIGEIDDYVIRRSTVESDNYGFYMVLKPKTTKLNEIKNKVKEYFDRVMSEEKDSKKYNLLVNRVEEEYLGYLIYVVGKKNESTLKKITESKEKLFSTLITVGRNEMDELDIVNDKDLDKYIMKVSGKLDEVNSYFIIKPKDNKIDDIKEDINKYFNTQEDKFSENSKELEILKNRLETEINGCLIYIVSRDNDKVLKIVQEELK